MQCCKDLLVWFQNKRLWGQIENLKTDKLEAPRCIVRMAPVQVVLQLTEQRWLWQLRKINSCVFSLTARVMWSTKSILYTAGVHLCACLFSPIHLEVCFPQRHKYRLRFESDLILLLSAENQLVLSGFVLIAMLVSLLWFGMFWFPSLFNNIHLGFACLVQSHFTEHLLVVATSYRRQLKSILFRNYCDHPCRMAQL